MVLYKCQQTASGTTLFLLVLFFSLAALLVQHHLAMISVLNRHLASVWTHSSALKIVMQNLKIKQQQEKITPEAIAKKVKAVKAAGAVTPGSRDANLPVFTNKTWHQMDNYQIILLKLIAFIDQRIENKPPTLRMLIYKNHGLEHHGACLVQNASTKDWKEIPGSFTLINLVSPKCAGGCAWRYEAYYFDCQLSGGAPITAAKLKLISKLPNRNSTAELSVAITNIRLAKPVKNPEHELVVCAKALYKYNVWLRLMLFIEVYEHLGASLFMLYNHSTTADTDHLLSYYINRGKVELIPWHSVPVENPEVAYFSKFEGLSKYGQILAHNHCLLSMIGRARHVILVDIDEFIVPAKWNKNDSLKNSLPRLLDSKSKTARKIGGFQVRSAFVNISFPEYQNLSTVSADSLHLPAIFRPFRHFEIQNPGSRCKMILKPEATDKMTVHRPFQYLNKFQEETFSPNDALIYHLRNKKLPGKQDDVVVNPFAPMENAVTDSIKKAVKTIQESISNKQ